MLPLIKQNARMCNVLCFNSAHCEFSIIVIGLVCGVKSLEGGGQNDKAKVCSACELS